MIIDGSREASEDAMKPAVSQWWVTLSVLAMPAAAQPDPEVCELVPASDVEAALGSKVARPAKAKALTERIVARLP